MNEFLAAPASFLPSELIALASQLSCMHFFMNELLAAPAKATTIAANTIFLSMFSLPRNWLQAGRFDPRAPFRASKNAKYRMHRLQKPPWFSRKSPSPGRTPKAANASVPARRSEHQGFVRAFLTRNSRFAPFLFSFSSASRTCLNSSSEALATRGNCKLSPSSAETMVEPITTRANHLWSAGTTCHGAYGVEVCRMISWYTAMYRGQRARSLMSFIENFQFFDGCSSRSRKRSRCSFFETLRKNFRI